MSANPASERIWTAALVVIGDEILSGRTQDKNIAQIAQWLNVQGIRLAEVRVVADGVQALAAVHEQRPDLVLTDVMMPELDGVGLLEAHGADLFLLLDARLVLVGDHREVQRGGDGLGLRLHGVRAAQIQRAQRLARSEQGAHGSGIHATRGE